MTQIQYFLEQISGWQYLDFVIRIFVACLCGAVIGYERSRRSKSAGIRTHIIVCCAACLMMIVSKYGFMDLTMPAGDVLNGTRGADPARIAAQVVSGISFIGAGVIFKHGSTVKGLTTAAGIWATAGIGLAIGAGMYVVGLVSVATIAAIQFILHKVKIDSEGLGDTNVDFNVREDENFNKEFLDQMAKWNVHIEEIEIEDGINGTRHYRALLRSSSSISAEDIIKYLSADERITRYSVIPDIPG